ncbi:CTP synthase (glutamine hydrolyzing) [Candidatus Micrarchaeota archaeon]|nr:CTP synthase (glutamine hydrolyzing) [Candidatus Micrarchaeota archaeon]
MADSGTYPDSKTRFIFITGGVMSGLGKGTATASIGRLIKNHNSKIVVVKCDGYLNVDPGTMNPTEHGEVYVLNDGTEVDMDFGHYERFIGVEGEGEWNITSGKLFSRLIEKERHGDFLGKTIQIIPHAVNEIIDWWLRLRDKYNPDYMLIEIGGTVGDIENSWFIEAAHRLKQRVGKQNIGYIHLTYVPMLYNTGELKTKPAQRDLALVNEQGISPDIVIVRSKYNLNNHLKTKISDSVGINKNRIINGIDMENIYEIPLAFNKQNILHSLEEIFNIKIETDMHEWEQLIDNIRHPEKEITIAICGKYTALHDSYASVIEALNHSGAHLKTKVNIKWIETTDIENGLLKVEDALKGVDGVIVPGGFGLRGIEGKIQIIRYVRENKIPFLGLCLGLQLAVIEFARDVCGLKDANSTEFTEEGKTTEYPIIDILPEQKNIDHKGGTMRLGAYPAVLKQGTIVRELYGREMISERHRHRYEVNPDYHKTLESNGLVLSGMSPDRKLVEFVELPKNVHPYFVATQAHPELKSWFEKPAPLFYGLVKSINENHL